MNDSDPIKPDGTQDKGNSTTNATGGSEVINPPPRAEGIEVNQAYKPGNKTGETNDPKQPSQQDILDRIRAGELWMIAFTAVVALTTVAQFIQSGCNNRSTSKQVDRIIGAADTQACAAQKIADASERNATAAESFSASAQGIETKTGKAVAQFQHLAGATQQAANVASESLTSVQRALVAFLGGITATKDISDNKISTLTLSLPLQNLGNTSTVGAISQINWKVFDPSGMPADFDFADQSIVQHTPIDIPSRAVGNATFKVPVQFLAMTKMKTTRFYVWEWTTYNDIFKKTPRHLTEFCDELTAVKITKDDATDPAADFSWELTLCTNAHYQCYDDQCADYTPKVKPKR
jgi:hypothetical protein